MGTCMKLLTCMSLPLRYQGMESRLTVHEANSLIPKYPTKVCKLLK